MWEGGFPRPGARLPIKLPCGMDRTGLKWRGLDETAIVFALAVDNQDNLYASGILRELGRVAKWDGESWTSLGDADHLPIAMAVDADDNLYAGGYFTEIDGVAADHIAAGMVKTGRLWVQVLMIGWKIS